ncbi:PREDICTED: probable cinnamyl alcohol dehydrogenase 6 [Tarenaya hassleriana]|uniref:probable cinnamyl alcohol dehydrogenase 6 n=1 Tax=Tarenaya hassleriana TaxID=28532 RepID=UPI00053C4E80|nr:PREDICTED: probable cinnamyl alcohol dehydrogenase 6 [Tarenaya hassleriana]
METREEREHPVKAFGWAAADSSSHLSPFPFSRRETGEEDVRIRIIYCGVCHTDLHGITNDWGLFVYPVVPGHEISGEVAEVGSRVTKFRPGDRVGVGCLVGACHACQDCSEGLENYCPKMVLTYGGIDRDGTVTYGGYSDHIVVNERYVIRFPDNMPLFAGAPLLCAGITMYSPMKQLGLVGPDKHVGIVGLGGLGHVGVKFAKAFGVKVTVIDIDEGKKGDALDKFGADSFLLSNDREAMEGAMNTMDVIIDTVGASHPLLPLIGLLKTRGTLVMVGIPGKPLELPVFPLVMGRKTITGTLIGGLKETQEMLDFAAKHDIVPEIEMIPMDYIMTAFDRLAKGDVRYRFVIDVANTLQSTKP